MNRLILSISMLILASGAGKAAADSPKYDFSAQATRSGNQIVLSVKVVENAMLPAPTDPHSVVETTVTRSSPRISLLEGQRAQIAITDHHDSKSTGDHDSAKVQSEIRVDCISVKGEDHLLVVTQIVDNGITVWADARKIPIDRQKSGTQPVPPAPRG
jgi:hypothetical protein